MTLNQLNEQCNPVTEEGHIFKREWFKTWTSDIYPKFNLIISAFETSFSTEIDSVSCASTSFGIFADEDGVKNIMLLNTWFAKLEFIKLLDSIRKKCTNIYDTNSKHPADEFIKPDFVLIENKKNEPSLVQSLRALGVTNTILYKSHKSYGNGEEAKVNRARINSCIPESGRVYIPTNARTFNVYAYFAEKSQEIFLDACNDYPSCVSTSRDIVNSFTMILSWLNDRKFFNATKYKKESK